MLNEFLYRNVNYFEYDGKSSLDFGILVESVSGVYGSPLPVFNKVNVPGRGTVLISTKNDELDNDEFEDGKRTYVVHMIPDIDSEQDLEQMARNLHSWLYRNVAYKDLNDSYDKDYRRKAYVADQMSIEQIAAGLMGRLEITFTCKAFKYDVKGLEKTVLTAAGSVFNTTGYTSYPHMRLYGSGEIILKVNDRDHIITIDDEYIDIDSELMSSYKEGVLKNSNTSMTHYPKLIPGLNNISWTGNLTRLEIRPRWCTL